jgi:Tol biopolymer transport system component
LAKVKDVGKSFSYRPIWSPDGQQVFVSVISQINSANPGNEIDNLFSFGQDGQVRQLTNFNESSMDVKIGTASISPNGGMIAFWLKLQPSSYKDQQLAVLDLATNRVTNYCIPGDQISGGVSAPIWSPDSRYLAVENAYEANASKVILVDIVQGWAAQIAENLTPAGWMANTP